MKNNKSCRDKKISKTMNEYKAGKLKSGKGGKIHVKSQKQALAISLAQATGKCGNFSSKKTKN